MTSYEPTQERPKLTVELTANVPRYVWWVVVSSVAWIAFAIGVFLIVKADR